MAMQRPIERVRKVLLRDGAVFVVVEQVESHRPTGHA
jgi:hypothetical protein